jgi:hypothetical protein
MIFRLKKTGNDCRILIDVKCRNFGRLSFANGETTVLGNWPSFGRDVATLAFFLAFLSSSQFCVFEPFKNGRPFPIQNLANSKLAVLHMYIYQCSPLLNKLQVLKWMKSSCVDVTYFDSAPFPLSVL